MPTMKKSWKVALAAVGAFLLVTFAVLYTVRMGVISLQSAAASREPISITVDELYKAYDEDVDAAELKSGGKRLRLVSRV
jgi:hypothetical protein